MEHRAVSLLQLSFSLYSLLWIWDNLYYLPTFRSSVNIVSSISDTQISFVVWDSIFTASSQFHCRWNFAVSSETLGLAQLLGARCLPSSDFCPMIFMIGIGNLRYYRCSLWTTDWMATEITLYPYERREWWVFTNFRVIFESQFRQPVCLLVCQCGDSRLKGSMYRNMLCTHDRMMFL